MALVQGVGPADEARRCRGTIGLDRLCHGRVASESCLDRASGLARCVQGLQASLVALRVAESFPRVRCSTGAAAWVKPKIATHASRASVVGVLALIQGLASECGSVTIKHALRLEEPQGQPRPPRPRRRPAWRRPGSLQRRRDLRMLGAVHATRFNASSKATPSRMSWTEALRPHTWPGVAVTRGQCRSGGSTLGRRKNLSRRSVLASSWRPVRTRQFVK